MKSYYELYIILLNIFLGITFTFIYNIIFYKKYKFDDFLKFIFLMVLSYIYIYIINKLLINFRYVSLIFLLLGYYISNKLLKNICYKIGRFINKINKIIIIIIKPVPFILLYKYIKKEIYLSKKRKELF